MIHSVDASREPIITELDAAVLVKEHISRLDVSVDYLGLMEKLQGQEQIINYCLDVY